MHHHSELVTQTGNMLTLVLLLSLPPIVVAAVVGTLFSLLQALTQIQEQTLAFAIKLIAVGLTLALISPWLGSQLYLYTVNLFELIRAS